MTWQSVASLLHCWVQLLCSRSCVENCSLNINIFYFGLFGYRYMYIKVSIDVILNPYDNQDVRKLTNLADTEGRI